MIRPGASFKDNLQALPPIDGLARIELKTATGELIASIANEPGKQGSLAVYQYLHQQFGRLDRAAAQHGLEIFAEHTADARNRPGAHPNIDRLFAVLSEGPGLEIELIRA
ncbi:DUF2322 family protein [Pseudogemmobacter faecipullorum]|uniref:DUF2322 family protein n=1 Tax=Pseudogemmobacter faecipullorum TaxID=2755041 RepID=A0ABS8CMD0_9RHOB|nr:DUF2322 family protein [Pseudogemmobacter faecipullorum]MCB5410323.1 DUF2322 family protein [Pseudogemmobacter faecipullorum]